MSNMSTPSNQVKHGELTQSIKLESQAKNNLLSGSGIVGPRVQDHFVNLDNGFHGVAGLVRVFLEFKGCVFPLGIEHTDKRSMAVVASVEPEEIQGFIEEHFRAGTIRYSRVSIANWLSTHLVKQGIIGKIKLTDEEHKELGLKKVCGKARTRIYLIEFAKD